MTKKRRVDLRPHFEWIIAPLEDDGVAEAGHAVVSDVRLVRGLIRLKAVPKSTHL